MEGVMNKTTKPAALDGIEPVAGMNLLREAIKAWPRHELASKQQLKTLRVGYIKARQILGDRYLLAVPVQKKDSLQ